MEVSVLFQLLPENYLCLRFLVLPFFFAPFPNKKVRSRSCAPKNAEPRLLRHKFRINPKVCETEDAFLPKQKRNLTIDPDINLCRKTILPRDPCKNKCTMRNNCKSYNKRAGSTEPAQFFYLQKELPNRSVKLLPFCLKVASCLIKSGVRVASGSLAECIKRVIHLIIQVEILTV